MALGAGGAPEAMSGLELTCNAISGIDDAFNNDTCLFCNETCEPSDSFERGRHLVEKHRYGQCNHDASYEEFEDALFRDHIVQFHQVTSHTLLASLQDHFLRAKAPFRVGWRRDQHSSGDKTQYEMPHEEESPQTGLMLQTELRQVIHSAKIVRENPLRASWDNSYFAAALRHLDIWCFSPVESELEIISLGLKAACIEEEMVVCGHDNLFIHRQLPDQLFLNQYALRKSAEWRSLEDSNKDVFTSLWLCRIPDALYRDPRLNKCRPCASHRLYPTRSEAIDHLRSIFHAPEYNHSLEHRIEEIPYKLNVSWTTIRSNCRNNKDMILSWLTTFFLESPTLRRILRSSEEVNCVPGKPPEAWMAALLESWDRDHSEDSSAEEVEAKGSDGAVDSRDNLSSLALSIANKNVQALYKNLGWTKDLNHQYSRKRRSPLGLSEPGASKKIRFAKFAVPDESNDVGQR